MNQTKKKNSLKKNDEKAFQNLWKADQRYNEYSPLYDNHTLHYFASPSVQKHINNLYKNIKNDSKKTQIENSKSEVFCIKRGIEKTNSKVCEKMQGKDSHIQIKIKPYCQDLRESSTFKLDDFKQNLRANQKLKDNDHKKYIKANVCKSKPQKAQIKIIKTLDPIKNLTPI